MTVCVAVSLPVAAWLCVAEPLGEPPCVAVGTLDDVAEPVVEPRWLPLTLWLPVAGSEGDDVTLGVGKPLELRVPLVDAVQVPVVEPRWVPLMLWLPVADGEGVADREGADAALRLSEPLGDGLPVVDMLRVRVSEAVTDGVDSWLGESVLDPEAVLPCDGVAVDVRPHVTFCVGEPLCVGTCDAEAVTLGEREPLGLVLAVPLRDGELLGESVRAWLGDAVAAWLHDADSEGVDDAVSVAERVRDSLRVAVVEGERLLVGELDPVGEGVPLPDPLPGTLEVRVRVSLLLPLALGVRVLEDEMLLKGDWFEVPVADELGVGEGLGESVALRVGS